MPAVVTLVAVSATRAILVGVASGLLVAVAVLAFVASGRRRRPGPDIPPGMRSGPSDPDLEKPVLEKLLALGGVFVLAMAIWVPAVWLNEPGTNKSDTEELIAKSIERGHLTTEPGTEENPLGFNCERCHGEGLEGGVTLFNDNAYPVPDLRTVCGGADFGHPLITGLDDVVTTIAQGRENTPMPSWSVRYAGAMDDQQIEDVVNYILSIQEVPDDQNVCLGNAPAAEASPSPSATPSG